MKRTQLNVSIDPKLLEKIKESARLSGKSLVGYVSDCFVNQIENLPVESIDSRFQMIEQRLQAIEKNIQLINPQTQNTPSFTSVELKNFNEANCTLWNNYFASLLLLLPNTLKN